MTYSGYYELNIDGVWDMIDRYFDHVRANGYFDERRRQQEKYWMYETINEQLRNSFYNRPGMETTLSEAERRVLTGQQTSFAAAGQLLDMYFENLRDQHAD